MQSLAIPGDLNGNGMVGMGDLTLFANSWLTDDGGDLDGDDDTDFADFCILAAHWLEGCDEAPTVSASDVSAGCALAGNVTFDLTATSSAALVYRVTSLPAYGALYDGTDDTLIDAVPFDLAGDSVRYQAHVSINTAVSFGWSAIPAANACGQVGSDDATAAITIYTVPTATPQSVNATAYIWQQITLAATDDGLPNPPGRLRYIITSLPAVGLLYDPKSGAGHINKVPYSLSSWGTDVLYVNASAGNEAFGFKATDGGVSPFGGESITAATVSITTAAHPLDCLSFDGRGYVLIPDGTYLDAVDGWSVDLWIQTRQPYFVAIDKRGSGAGYEIRLVAGRPYMMIWDTTGALYYLCGDKRIDDGQWHEIQFAVYSVPAENKWEIFLAVRDVEVSYSYNAGSIPEFSNAEPVILGSGFKGQIDKLRYFSGITNPVAFEFIVQFGLRTNTEGMFEMVPNLSWMCDEGTGTTITDSKAGKVGTFNSANHVIWHPWIVPFIDAAAQQYYYGGGR